MIRLLLLVTGQLAALRWSTQLIGPQLGVLGSPAASTSQVVVAVLHVAVTASVGVLLAGTIHDMAVVVASGGRHRGRAPRWVRRLVDQAIGTVLLVTIAATPALADTRPADHLSADFSDPDRAGEDDGDDVGGTSSRPMSAGPGRGAPSPALARPPVAAQLPLAITPDLPAPSPATTPAATAGPDAPLNPDPASSPPVSSPPVSSSSPPASSPSVSSPPAAAPATAPSGSSAPTSPAPSGQGDPQTLPAPPATVDPDAEPATAGVGQHVVATGENLWVIARAHLLDLRAGDDSLPPLHDRAVHAYWVRLIEANRGQLRSGDPDLIHPGERLILPPPADRGAT